MGNPRLDTPSLIAATGRFGWLGVEIFFVISGYILPYAMDRRRYELRDFGGFMARRIVRLEPPYIVSIIIVILLGFASMRLPGFNGTPMDIDPIRLLLHLTYTVDLAGGRWLNSVYWTLAIELQFYFLIALCFPLLRSTQPWLPLAIVALALAAGTLVDNGFIVLHWLGVFASGTLTYLLHVRRMSTRMYLVCIAALALGAIGLYGTAVMLAAALAALIIAYADLNAKPLLYLGAISYSFYLLHIPIAGRVINLAVRLEPGIPGTLVAIFSALAISIGAAHILNRLVESPARRLAARIGQRAAR